MTISSGVTRPCWSGISTRGSAPVRAINSWPATVTHFPPEMRTSSRDNRPHPHAHGSFRDERGFKVISAL